LEIDCRLRSVVVKPLLEAEVIDPNKEHSQVDYSLSDKRRKSLEEKEIARLKRNANYIVVREHE